MHGARRLLAAVSVFGMLLALGYASPDTDTPPTGESGGDGSGWRDNVLRLAQSMSSSASGHGMFPWVAKRVARKKWKSGLRAGKAAILAGEGQPVPNVEPPRFSGSSATTGSVAHSSSILEYEEGGFLVTRPHIGVRFKRKLCMRCWVIFDGSKGSAAAAATVGQQLAAAKEAGLKLQGDNAAGIAGRLAAAAATGDPFFGTNPRDGPRRDKDEQLRKCLTLPEGIAQKVCKERLNGRSTPVEDPHSVVNPTVKEAVDETDQTDPRHLKNNPAKPYEAGQGGSDEPQPDTGFPYKSAKLLQVAGAGGGRGGNEEGEGGSAGLLQEGGSSLEDELFKEMLRLEPEGPDEEEELAGGRVSPERMREAAKGDKPLPSKAEMEAAAALAGPSLNNKRWAIVGGGGALTPEDMIDQGPGGGSLPIIDAELCMNEGSRAFVYAIWRGLFDADFPGATVGCNDANP